MKGGLRSTIVTLLFAAFLGSAACQNGSPGPGENCTGSGGECIDPNAACGESLPYPCPGSQVCCVPPSPTHDAGGG
jgi:hypothetical protein